jgi:hypothetical protein
MLSQEVPHKVPDRERCCSCHRKQALETKAKNGGQMPDERYTNYVSKMKKTPVGCHMVITTEDIQNRVRVLEKAAAADLALVPSVRHQMQSRDSILKIMISTFLSNNI